MTAENAKILIVEDEDNMRQVLAGQIARHGYQVVQAEDGARALELIRSERPDVVLTDLQMPGLNGMELLAQIKIHDGSLPVLMLTAHGNVENAVEAMRRGAFDFLTKPFDPDELAQALDKAVATRRLSSAEPAGDRPGALVPLLGNDPKMLELERVVGKIADSPSTILIMGESGTGKELLARMIHERSQCDGPFIPVHCAAIPETLLESELFGHEKGAFTGATASKPGRFELADGGTLFLDEVGTIPLSMQVKLLRVLQDQTFQRVGGVRMIHVNVRLVAATNVDLKQEVQAGRFREDLYYRLAVVPLQLPALRQRRGDIAAIAQTVIDRLRNRLDRPRAKISPEALAALAAYDWPGNVRELENVLERSLLLADVDELEPEDLPSEVVGARSRIALSSGDDRPEGDQDDLRLKPRVKSATAALERELIKRALARTEGNVTRAAELLGLSRKGLQLKLRELGLRRDEAAGD
ncbi:MAG: sigma-54 dependent transcriptional regulator [Candidatus Alcyoniella australis]|nr:sigma-54 dependent transcriptional regulator [Candidatus Alcyoniella australis]